MLNHCIAGFLHVGVRTAVWLSTHVSTLGGVIGRLVCGVGRSIGNLFHSARRRPFVTAAVIVAIAFAWLVFGTTPLLSVTGVVVLGRWLGEGVVRLALRWLLVAPADSSEEPMPMPERNGRPVKAPAGIS